MKKKTLIEEVKKFIAERQEMERQGFPYCFSEDGVQMHCDACIKVWKLKKKIHQIQTEIEPF